VAAVRDFVSRHYSAEVMKLAVVGRQPLDELEAMVRDKFGEVAGRGLKPPVFPGAAGAVCPSICPSGTPVGRGLLVPRYVCRFFSAVFRRICMLSVSSARHSRSSICPRSRCACWAEDVITASEKGRLIRLVPEKDGHSLQLQWSVPPETPAYRAAPCGYLSHLLGCAQRRASLDAMHKSRNRGS
jgi:secreted Zn-dependent insulinase-like peptidase